MTQGEAAARVRQALVCIAIIRRWGDEPGEEIVDFDAIDDLLALAEHDLVQVAAAITIPESHGARRTGGLARVA